MKITTKVRDGLVIVTIKHEYKKAFSNGVDRLLAINLAKKALKKLL